MCDVTHSCLCQDSSPWSMGAWQLEGGLCLCLSVSVPVSVPIYVRCQRPWCHVNSSMKSRWKKQNLKNCGSEIQKIVLFLKTCVVSNALPKHSIQEKLPFSILIIKTLEIQNKYSITWKRMIAVWKHCLSGIPVVFKLVQYQDWNRGQFDFDFTYGVREVLI